MSGYRVLETSTVKESGMELDLQRLDNLHPLFEDEVMQLKCVISYETDSRLRVQIFDPKKDRYEVSLLLFFYQLNSYFVHVNFV